MQEHIWIFLITLLFYQIHSDCLPFNVVAASRIYNFAINIVWDDPNICFALRCSFPISLHSAFVIPDINTKR
uniref:Bm1258 n=1 Tax=Brugia malayi TaxID=6279 RepID=A0A1I9G1I2_BRUMA|nr:Bm1258 [Brugia malayi]